MDGPMTNNAIYVSGIPQELRDWIEVEDHGGASMVYKKGHQKRT